MRGCRGLGTARSCRLRHYGDAAPAGRRPSRSQPRQRAGGQDGRLRTSADRSFGARPRRFARSSQESSKGERHGGAEGPEDVVAQGAPRTPREDPMPPDVRGTVAHRGEHRSGSVRGTTVSPDAQDQRTGMQPQGRPFDGLRRRQPKTADIQGSALPSSRHAKRTVASPGTRPAAETTISGPGA